jgi:hypothetical protein
MVFLDYGLTNFIPIFKKNYYMILEKICFKNPINYGFFGQWFNKLCTKLQKKKKKNWNKIMNFFVNPPLKEII